MVIGCILFGIVSFVFLFLIFVNIASIYSNSTFYCKYFDYHKPEETGGFDGASFTSKCKRCERSLLMDSYGCWFSIKN